MPWRDNSEPAIEDVLGDPSITALMARDRVDPDKLRVLLHRLKHSLASPARRERQARSRRRTAHSDPSHVHSDQ
jgi:hypothetical protein